VNREGCVGAWKGRVRSGEEEEAKEFWASGGEREGVTELGMRKASCGVGDLVGRRRLRCGFG